MIWHMGFHKARAQLSHNVRLRGVRIFGLIKEKHAMANGLSTDFAIIQDLPRNLLKPRCSLQKKSTKAFCCKRRARTRLEREWIDEI